MLAPVGCSFTIIFIITTINSHPYSVALVFAPTPTSNSSNQSNDCLWSRIHEIQYLNKCLVIISCLFRIGMGNICERPDQTPASYRSPIKELSSIISELKPTPSDEELQLITLTSQNTQSSFQVESGPNSNQHKTNGHVKTIEDFDILRVLGKGAFGQVLLVRDKINSKHYAMKIINKDTIGKNQSKMSTLSERYLLEALDNPFIVRLHYAFQSASKLYLLVDFMSGGELFFLLRNNQVFEEKVARFYAAEIVLALEYLHNRNIIYRDLKPENILLSKEGHIKLSDFGLSKICFNRNQLSYSICGTPEYMAPEIISGKGYDQSADWFSFGSLLYDMLTGKPPFYSKNKKRILQNITKKRVPIPETLSPAARSLLAGLFAINPKQRLGYNHGAQQIKQHEFFKEIDFEELGLLKVQPPFDFENAEINIKGFQQEQLNGSQLDNMVSQEGKAQDDTNFKDFTYFKQQTFSQDEDQGKEQLKVKNILPSIFKENRILN